MAPDRPVQATLALLLIALPLAGLPLPGAATTATQLQAATLTFYTPGTDVSMVETVPLGSQVLTAQLHVGGQEINPGGAADVYQFGDGRGHQMWDGVTVQDVNPEKPADLQDNVITNTTPMEDFDGTQVQSALGSNTYHHVRFDVEPGEVAALTVEWTGMGACGQELLLLVFDHAAQSWTEVASEISVDFFVTQLDGTISDDAIDYVDPLTDSVDVVATHQILNCAPAPDSRATGGRPSHPIGGGVTELASDVMTLTLDRGPAGLPTGVALDLGDDGDAEWVHTTALGAAQTVDFLDALQQEVDDLTVANPSAQTAPLPLAWSVATGGRLVIDSIDVQYDVRARWLPWPATLQLDEDSPQTTILDVEQYLDDPDTATADVTYSLDSVSPAGVVTVVLSGSLLIAEPTPDWHGTVDIGLTAHAGDTETAAPPLTLHVQGVNDGPVLSVLEPQSVDEGQTLHLTAAGTDVDEALDPSEELTFSVGPGGPSIDPGTGDLQWTPMIGQVGSHSFTVTLTDADGEFDTETLTVEVTNVNDPPAFEGLQHNWVAEEDRLFARTVEATDIDLQVDPAEELTFTDDTDLFDIDPATGVVRFTPPQEQVGSHVVTLTVADLAGDKAMALLTVEVRNTNDAPTLEGPSSATVVAGQELVLAFAAADPDREVDDSETLTADLEPAVGTVELPEVGTVRVRWTPSLPDVGTMDLRLIVRDRSGATAERVVTVTILLPNQAPTVTLKSDTPVLTKGAPWVVKAVATDPDGDALTYSWSVDGTVQPSLTTADVNITGLGVGEHNVSVRVSDGEAEATATAVVVVKAPPKGPGSGSQIPGFGLPLVLLAIGALSLLRRRLEGRPGQRR